MSVVPVVPVFLVWFETPLVWLLPLLLLFCRDEFPFVSPWIVYNFLSFPFPGLFSTLSILFRRFFNSSCSTVSCDCDCVSLEVSLLLIDESVLLPKFSYRDATCLASRNVLKPVDWALVRSRRLSVFVILTRQTLQKVRSGLSRSRLPSVRPSF